MARAGSTQRAKQLGGDAITALGELVAIEMLGKLCGALIGPTVCELDGPMPTLNRSKVLIDILASGGWRPLLVCCPWSVPVGAASMRNIVHRHNTC